MPKQSLHTRSLRLSALGGLLLGASAAAQADAPLNSVQIGVAQAMFNVDSGDMWGPPGTTPGGIKTNVKDKTVLSLIYDRRISGPWSVTLQAGMPPILALEGAGNAASMGKIGSVRAWFPAVMGTYTWDATPNFALHGGAGLHYTFFTDGSPNGTYNAGFGGTSSRAKFSSNLGPLVKVGGTWSFDQNWFVDFSYSRYWIKTTATIDTDTPGVGNVQRKIKVRADPDVLSLTVGYRF